MDYFLWHCPSPCPKGDRTNRNDPPRSPNLSSVGLFVILLARSNCSGALPEHASRHYPDLGAFGLWSLLCNQFERALLSHCCLCAKRRRLHGCRFLLHGKCRRAIGWNTALGFFISGEWLARLLDRFIRSDCLEHARGPNHSYLRLS